MHLSIKILELKSFSIKDLIVLCLFAFLVIVSCAENSDKMVVNSLDVKEFEVDQINDEDFKFDTFNLIESIVLVEGIIKDINYLNNRSTIILKGKENRQRLVICDMQDNQKSNIKSFNLGDTIKVKGRLKGTLNDLILLNCIIPQPKTNE